MAKICFSVIVFNGNYVLEECLRSILPFGKVIASEGPVQFWQDRGFTISTDGTNGILRRFLPEENIVHGQWREKDDEVNATLHLVPDDTTHIFAVDSDEIWKKEDLQRIIGMLDNYDSVSFKANSFFGGFDRIMGGFEENFEVHRIQRWYPGARWATHRPPTILAPDNRPWSSHRHLNHEATDAMGIRFYHYSYCFPRQMIEKHTYYDATLPGVMIPDYLRKVYLPWVMGQDREGIEAKYQGVHNFYPERRGPAFTKKFEGKHPYWIDRNMDVLKAKFSDQLKEMLWTLK